MKALLSVFFLVAGWEAVAQSVFSNEINSGIQAVLQDYPNDLKNTRGELLAKRGQTSDYASRVSIPGVQSAVITESRGSLSWKVTMFKESDFDRATQKFEELFRQINKAIIKSNDKPFILSGNYSKPGPTRTTVIRFQLLPSMGDLKDVVVELSMHRAGRDYVGDINITRR
jgi:hypothetical protein